MNVSILNAESRQSDWGKRAYAILEEFVFHSSGEFMAEDVREYAKRNKSIEEPPSQRAWGSIFSMAIRNRLIKVIGIRKVKNARAHLANANFYIRN
jgi:hypothetical protein